MLIKRKSMFSGIEHERELEITEEQVRAYEAGALLQHAFPQLSKEDREFFKSGVTPEEWLKIFGTTAEPVDGSEEENDE